MPEAMLVALTGESSPRLVTRDESTYPLERLLDLIDHAQRSSAPGPDALITALHDPLPVMRYWATIGAMRAPGSATLTAGLVDRLTDDEPSIRLAAAHSLLRQGDSSAASAVIVDCLAPANSGELRLAAMNVITLQGKWPEWLEPSIAAPGSGLGRGGENYVAAAADYLLKTPGRPRIR